MTIDPTDKKLLGFLQDNSDISTSELAEKLHMSQSPCWRRVNRLEEQGIIHKRVAVLDREALGIGVVVFATVNLTQTGRQNLLEFERMIEGHPEVLECYTMAGAWDYMLKIVAKDIRHYEMFVREKLTKLTNIGEVHSHIAVTEIKNSTVLPLDSQL